MNEYIKTTPTTGFCVCVCVQECVPFTNVVSSDYPHAGRHTHIQESCENVLGRDGRDPSLACSNSRVKGEG